MLIWLDADTLPPERPQPELRPRADGTLHHGYRQLHPGRRRPGRPLPSRAGSWTPCRAGSSSTPTTTTTGSSTSSAAPAGSSGEDIVTIVTHEPASHRWVISRLWSWLAYPVTPNAPIVQDFVHGYAKDLNITNLLDEHVPPPGVRSPAGPARAGQAAHRTAGRRPAGPRPHHGALFRRAPFRACSAASAKRPSLPHRWADGAATSTGSRREPPRATCSRRAAWPAWPT